MSNSVSDFLAQSDFDSHPGFKFSEAGQKCRGTIVSEPRIVNTEDLNGGTSDKLVLDVETPDGTFSLWLPTGKGITKAVAKAVKEAGADGLAQGGKIAVEYTGDGTPSKPGYNPPKLFTAVYEAPARTVPVPGDVDDPFA